MFQSEQNGNRKTTKSHHAEAHFGLADRGAAAQHAEEKQDGADAEDDGGGDQRVSVLDEALEVIVAVDHVGSHVGQRPSCSLRGGETVSISRSKPAVQSDRLHLRSEKSGTSLLFSAPLTCNNPVKPLYLQYVITHGLPGVHRNAHHKI